MRLRACDIPSRHYAGDMVAARNQTEPVDAEPTVQSGLTKVWRWLNAKGIFPWIPLVAAGIWTVASWDAEVKAQSEQLKTEREHVNQALAEVRVRHQEFREELLFHLSTLKDSIESGNEETAKRMEKIESGVQSLNTDMAVVCTKIAGKCRLGGANP